jgi:hypothetical protein
MIKIVYKESSIECSTKEEMRAVLRVLNEIRKENAKEASLTCLHVKVNGLTIKSLAEKSESLGSASPKARPPKLKVH